MIIVVPFINSTGLAIVARRICAVVIFYPKKPKSCHHKLVVFTSFWSWLLNVSSVLSWLLNVSSVLSCLLKVYSIFELHSERFLGCYCVVDMLKVYGTTDFLILFFYVSEISLLLRSTLMRFFVVQTFSFLKTVWG